MDYMMFCFTLRRDYTPHFAPKVTFIQTSRTSTTSGGNNNNDPNRIIANNV
jgi:hypothetical protein